jgi:hypothetical protein
MQTSLHVSNTKTSLDSGLPKHKMLPTHKATFCKFITENIRRESLSGIIDKLGRNRLGLRNKELKIM